MKKVLTITVPLLKGRLHIAYPMIAFMQHRDGKTFLYNSFINLECFSKVKDLNFCFTTPVETSACYSLHYLNIHKMYEDFTEEKGMECVEAIKDEINQENYIYIAFDDYYLPCKEDRHFLHINLIFGYDNASRNFLSAGYDTEGIYRQMPIPFDVARQAFCYKKVEVFRPNHGKRFIFDPKFLISQINDFLLSQNSFLTEEEMQKFYFSKEDFSYGLSVYDRLFSHLMDYANGEELDFRNIHQLYESSLINEKRMIYLKNNLNYNITDELIHISKKLNEETMIMRNFALKSMVKSDRNLAYKIMDKLKIHQEETKKMYVQLRDIFNELI